jgi:hypothetical protein
MIAIAIAIAITWNTTMSITTSIMTTMIIRTITNRYFFAGTLSVKLHRQIPSRSERAVTPPARRA